MNDDKIIQLLNEAFEEAEAKANGFNTVEEYEKYLTNKQMEQIYDSFVNEKISVYSIRVIYDTMTDTDLIHKYYVNKLFRHPSLITTEEIQKHILLGDIKIKEVPQYFYDWVYYTLQGVR